MVGAGIVAVSLASIASFFMKKSTTNAWRGWQTPGRPREDSREDTASRRAKSPKPTYLADQNGDGHDVPRRARST